MIQRRRLLRLVAILCLLLAGCGGNPASEPSASAVRRTALKPVVAGGAIALPAVTEEECVAFAESLEAAVLAGDSGGFHAAVDWDAILDEVTKDIEADTTQGRGFEKGFRSTLSQNGLGSQIVGVVQAGGSYTFIRAHEEDGQFRALFRLVHPESAGVNYHDMPLHRTAGGSIKAADIYILLSGEFLSQTIRRTYVMAVSSNPGGLLGRLAGWESDFARHVNDCQKMNEAVQAGRGSEALGIYRKLPASLKRDKNVLLVRLRAAQQSGDDEYASAIGAFRRCHPQDPCIDFLSIDGHILRKEYPQALEAVARAEKSVGHDAYFDVLRASIHLLAGEHDAARECAERAAAEEPTLIDARWMLVTVSLQEERFEETARLLDRIAWEFGVEFSDLTTVPDYAGFVKSPEYAAWLKARTNDE